MLRALISPFVVMSDRSDWCEVHAGDGDLCVVDLHHPLRVGVGSPVRVTGHDAAETLFSVKTY